MTTFSIGTGFLNIGNRAGNIFHNAIMLISSTVLNEGISPQAAIEKLLTDNTLTSGSPDEIIIKAMRKWLTKKGNSKLAELLEPIHVLETASDKARRKIGWPSKEWAVPLAGAGNLGPFAFSIDTEGGISFDLLEEGKNHGTDIPGFDGAQANASIRILGFIEGAAKANVPIPYGGINIDASASLSREINYHYGFQSQNSLTGVALASALKSIEDPTSGLKLLSKFSNTASLGRLLAIEMQGKESLGGELGITPKLPTGYGTFGLDLNGKVSLSNDFQMMIAEGSSDKKISLKAKTLRERGRSVDLGVSYTVGLSTISPQAATALLKNAEGLHDLIVKIDDKAGAWAGKIKSWLKPGDLIKEKILEIFSSEFESVRLAADTTPLTLITRVFGVTDRNLTSDEAIELASEQLGGVISNIIDEMPDLFEISEDQVRERIHDVLKDALPAKAIVWLDTNILTKINGELDKALTDLASKIDAAAMKRIKKFVDGPNKKVDALREFITEVRGLSKKILDGISRAQTDLLAAEIGYARAKNKQNTLDYKTEIDLGVEENKTLFRQAVLAPSKFGRLLFSENTIEGVSIVNSNHLRQITKTSGHRWSVALIGQAFSGSISERKHISILDNKHGVTIASNGAIKKTRSLLGETRRASFFSAMHIFEARTHSAGSGEPNASATIKIDFEEDDDNLKVKEATALLERLKTYGSLSEDTFQAVKSAVENQRQSINGDLEATLSMSLAIPPSQFVRTLRAIYNGRPTTTGLLSKGVTGDFVLDAILTGLAEIDGEKIKSLAPKNDESSGLDLSGGNMGLATGSIISEDMNTIRGRQKFLGNLVSNNSIMGLDGSQGQQLSNLDQDRIKYKETIEAVYELLYMASQLYYDEEISGTAEELREILYEWQKNMNKMAKKYLEVGTPLPGWLSGIKTARLPKKTAALFRALQIIAHSETGVVPPLTVSFKPKTGMPKTFISLPK